MMTSTSTRPQFRIHPSLWLCAASLLAFPAIGTLMSDEVNWGIEDFAAFALMLGGLCMVIEVAWHRLDAPRWRIGAILFGVLMFLTFWAHLAVGLLD